MTRRISHITRVIIACALGSVFASIVIWSLYLYHPVQRLPADVKDTAATIFTGLLSIAGGMLEHWRIDRKAKKLTAERKDKDDGA